VQSNLGFPADMLHNMFNLNTVACGPARLLVM
jgi:hypothetical protein